MYLFRKSKNNVVYNNSENQKDEDDFVIVNDGVTQSGWVDVNRNNVNIDSNNNNNNNSSNILPIYQIKQQQLYDMDIEETKQEQQSQQQQQQEDLTVPDITSQMEIPVAKIMEIKSIIEEEKEQSQEILFSPPTTVPEEDNFSQSINCEVESLPEEDLLPKQQPIILKSTTKSENVYASPSTTIKPYFTRSTVSTSNYTTTTSSSPVPIRGGFTRANATATNYATNSNVKSYFSTSKSNENYCNSV